MGGVIFWVIWPEELYDNFNFTVILPWNKKNGKKGHKMTKNHDFSVLFTIFLVNGPYFAQIKGTISMFYTFKAHFVKEPLV